MDITGKAIAKRLGLSAATVSLALNDRPGVNAETRAAILTCRDEMMREAIAFPGAPKRVVLLNNEDLTAPDFGLYYYSYMELFRVLNSYGYLLETEVFDRTPAGFREQLNEILRDGAAGLIIFAANMPKGCMAQLSKASVPMMIFDSNFRLAGADNLLIDNAGGIEQAVELFRSRGIKEIYYLSHANNVNFNFLERRAAIKKAAEMMEDFTVHIRTMGKNIDEARKNGASFLEENAGKPVAVLMENYQTALGVLGAAQQLGLRFPEEIFPVSFDELPESVLLPYAVPMIRVPHISKAKTGALRLVERMSGKAEQEITYSVRTTLLNGG